MNTHLFSNQWFASVQQTIQNASDSRAALHEAVRAISEQVDAIASMGLEYTWIESPRELVKVLSGEAADKDSQACWSWVGEIMDLHARSKSLDEASFAKEVEVALQSSPGDPEGRCRNSMWPPELPTRSADARRRPDDMKRSLRHRDAGGRGGHHRGG